MLLSHVSTITGLDYFISSVVHKYVIILSFHSVLLKRFTAGYKIITWNLRKNLILLLYLWTLSISKDKD
jgi:hypothetical protein